MPEPIALDTMRGALDAYLGAVERGDRLGAVAVALDLVERGYPAERVITELVAAAQAQVGRGWLEGRWTVAMEHRASGIAESVISAVAETAMRTPGAPVEGSRGRVVVACSESEWHVLPGRMASEVLRMRGMDVTYVGPSVPATELAAMIGEDPPSSVAVTCSMPLSLVGTWRTISALRGLGVFIVCGGRGFGPHGQWGLALGADAWAPDFSVGADLVIASLEAPRPPAREPVGDVNVLEELRVVGRDHASYVEAGLQRALTLWPDLALSDAAIRATREDLGSTLRAVSAATLVADETLLADYVVWFEELLAARGLPLFYVPAGMELLLHALPTELEQTRAMARRGLSLCRASATGAEA